MAKFTFSKHSVERFFERFPGIHAKGLTSFQMRHDYLVANTKDFIEDKSWKNDTRRTVFLFEKYGDRQHRVFTFKKAYFVGLTTDEGDIFIVTCMTKF